jgi:hypothetical protein
MDTIKMAKRRQGQKKTLTEREKRKVEGFPLVVETSITYTPGDRVNPLKYRLQLYHETTRETLVRYDIHHGKSHHRHFLGQENVEVWQGLEKTIAAFQQDIETIKTHMREGIL